MTALTACGADGGGGGLFDGPGQVEGSLTVFTPGVASATGPAPTWSDRMPEVFRKAKSLAARSEASRVAQTRRGVEGVLTNPLPWNPGFSGAPEFTHGAFVEGEVLVTLRSGGLERVPRLSEVSTLSSYAFSTGVFGSETVATIRFRDRENLDRPISPEETRWVRSQLDGHPAFVRAELNYYRWAYAVPDDATYGTQWHYPLINLPTAWDLTTGSPQVVVAVIDDGVNTHPELDRVIAGYDMISDTQIAGDGDGRDAEAQQVPLSHGTSSVWHGTHVAGTVGATSDNQVGAAGVDWQARLLPVRVLGRVVPGRGAGTSVDVIAGINWSVGVNVPGVPANSTPAQVLNLSLGGGPTLQAEQEAINAAVASGAVVVVAAGNENIDADGRSLAGYDNVIVVGATDYEGRRSPYSNFGAVVDVMAPGGDMRVDGNADGQPDGVLSTYLDRDGQRTGLQFLEGTSMASPHVAGVAALMKAVNPQLTAADVERILKETANADARCSEGCGAGLVNAGAAVLAAQGGNMQNDTPAVSLGAARLNLGAANASGSVNIFNSGGGQLNWQARVEGQGLQIEGAASGTLEGGRGAAVTVAVDRTGLADGEYQGLLVVSTNGGEATAAVLYRVGAVSIQDVGAILVATAGFDDAGEVIVGGAVETNLAGNYAFSMESDPGEWLVIGLADLNGNEELDDGDYWGIYTGLDDPRTVVVEPAGIVRNIGFTMVPFAGEAEVAPPACGAFRECFEACGGDAACEDACPTTPECQMCFTDVVGGCAAREGCAPTDLNCLCGPCVPELDRCFGPLLCSQDAMPMPRQAPLGGTCDGGAVTCEAPFACDMSVAGGYCTRSCFFDGICGDGVCIEADLDDDGLIDDAFCFASCTGDGTCPRPADACLSVGTALACIPQ